MNDSDLVEWLFEYGNPIIKNFTLDVKCYFK